MVNFIFLPLNNKILCLNKIAGSSQYPLAKYRFRTASRYRAILVVKLVRLNCKGLGFESHPSSIPVIFFPQESGKYGVYSC